MRTHFAPLLAFAFASSLCAQQPTAPKPEDTEVWAPVPKVVTPGATAYAPPSDAIILFDGRNLDEWVSTQDKTPAQWTVADGILTVKKAPGVGNIETRRAFRNYQVNDALFGQARPDAVFMHCLPAKRDEEVTDSIMEHPRSVIFHQAENRLHAQKALLLMILN